MENQHKTDNFSDLTTAARPTTSDKTPMQRVFGQQDTAISKLESAVETFQAAVASVALYTPTTETDSIKTEKQSASEYVLCIQKFNERIDCVTQKIQYILRHLEI